MEPRFRFRSERLPLVVVVAILLSLTGAGASAGQPLALPTLSPPSNDDFANATVIGSLPFTDIVDITAATMEPGEPQYCYYLPMTVWYEFTPASSMLVQVDHTGYGFSETSVAVYQAAGSGMADLNPQACASYGSGLRFTAQAGTTYYIQAGTFYGGTGQLQINLNEIPPPPNDNFAAAMVIAELPFADNVDIQSATTEQGEPTSTPCGATSKTVWYTYTPTESSSLSIWADSWYSKLLAVYTGGSLDSLTSVGCGSYWGSGPLTFLGEAGKTYSIQAGSVDNYAGPLSFRLEEAPQPVAGFWYYSEQPNIFSPVQFSNNSYDPAGLGIQTVAWDFGDGATSTEWSPSHQYAPDGDYTVMLTVTTPDGRTASTSQTVPVRTHDVAIVRLAAPNAASVGQTRAINVEIKNVRYPERVHIELYKSAPSGNQFLASTQQNIPVRSGNRTTTVSLSYTFAAEDAFMGKVTFRATAYVVDHPDALQADNEAISAPTKVSK